MLIKILRMDKNLHNIEDLFRKGLGGNEEIPSPNIWDRIDETLDKDKVIRIGKKYTFLKKIIFFLVFFLIGLSIYVWNKRNNDNPERENSVILNKEKTKDSNSVLPSQLNKIDLIKPVDSLSTNANNNQKLITGIGKSNIGLLNSSISKQEELPKNKPKTGVNIKLPDHVEDGYQVDVKRSNIDLNSALLSLNQSDPLHVTRLKTAKPTRQSRFFITGFFSPDMPFYRLKDNDSGSQSDYLSKIENNENEAFSLTTGVLIDYKLRSNWSLQSGLTFVVINTDLNPGIIYAQNDNFGKTQYRLNTSSGYGYVLPSFSNSPRVGDSLYSHSTSHRLKYLGIPLAVQYSINRGKFTLNAMTGISSNFLTQGNITTEVEKGNNSETETTDKITGLKKFYINSMVGIGLGYNFYKNLSVSFSPTLRFALNSVNKDVPVKSFPNSLGFSFGVKTKL